MKALNLNDDLGRNIDYTEEMSLSVIQLDRNGSIRYFLQTSAEEKSEAVS